MWIQQARYKAVGKVLKAAREAANLTQKELASRLSKPQSFVSSCEAGQRRVDVLELERLAEALGVQPSKLFASVIKPQQTKSKN